jgi:hypothetical protein
LELRGEGGEERREKYCLFFVKKDKNNQIRIRENKDIKLEYLTTFGVGRSYAL